MLALLLFWLKARGILNMLSAGDTITLPEATDLLQTWPDYLHTYLQRGKSPVSGLNSQVTVELLTTTVSCQ